MISRTARGLIITCLSLVACNEDTGATSDTDRDDVDTVTARDTDGDLSSSNYVGRADQVPNWHLSWLRDAGGGSADSLLDLSFSSHRSVITGYYYDSITFGPGEENETVLKTLHGEDSFFIALHEPDGRLVFARNAEGFRVVGHAVAGTDDGGAMAAGYYEGHAVFGAGEPNETSFSCDEAAEASCSWPSNIFITRYQPSGDLTWAKAIRSVRVELDPRGCDKWENSCWAQANDIAVGTDGSMVLAAHFDALMAFDLGTADEVVFESTGGWFEQEKWDCLLAMFDQDGKRLWHRVIGGPGRDGCSSVLRQDDGTFFVTGHYEGEIVIGAGEPAETRLVTPTFTSAFIARFNDDGSLIWARDLGIDGDVNSQVGALERMSNGEVVVSGRYSGRMTAGDGEEGEVIETAMDGRGMFIARYSSDGQRIWNRVILSSGTFSWARDVAELRNGSLIAVGSVSGQATFGVGEQNETTVGVPDQIQDAWIAELTSAGHLLWVLSQGGPCTDSFNAVEAFHDEATGSEWVIVAGNYCGDVWYGTGGGDELLAVEHDNDFYDFAVLRYERD